MKFHCSTDFLPIHVKHTFRLIRLIQLIVLYNLKDRAISIASKYNDEIVPDNNNFVTLNVIHAAKLY